MSVYQTKLNRLDERFKRSKVNQKLPPVLIADVDEKGLYTINSLNKTFKSEKAMNNFLEKTYQDQKYVLIIDDIRKWD